ncbi:hypothetical protein FO438_11755 [Weissella cibaria]|uniref:prealbumin-like fold domain-containing protein n=1 Tax=Weissella cibaria TaxID=137591 RepID=UPI0011927889|nr:prealbumin-like fold domain-containing protein [Weissella cibaria]TVV39355.1 hypothetical protein FO438_11755 [Weissella cibaria]
MQVVGKHLANAEFRLTGDNNVNVTGKSDDDGDLTFTDLKPGQYVLEETKAPSGYHIMAKKLNITIDNQGKVSFSDSTVANEVTLSQGDKHNQITVTIKNSRMVYYLRLVVQALAIYFNWHDCCA